MVRLNKYLAQSGVCSRRKADQLILENKVKVNGKIVNLLGTLIDENKDKVFVCDSQCKAQDRKIYIVLNKPAGYITTSKEQFNRPYIMELIHEDIRVFPCGRLDLDTEGLIILTNDGDFANMLMHPSRKIDKTYEAKVLGNITKEKIKKLEEGVRIEDYITSKAKVRMLSKNVLEIIIHEGKNRQIKKMCRAVGLKVESLKRTKIGNLNLDNINVGEYKIFSENKIKSMIFKKNKENAI